MRWRELILANATGAPRGPAAQRSKLRRDSCFFRWYYTLTATYLPGVGPIDRGSGSSFPFSFPPLSNLCFGRRGVKTQGVLGPKNGRLFSSVGAVRWKTTWKPAITPQNCSDKCSTAASRALPLGTTSPSSSRGNDELRYLILREPVFEIGRDSSAIHGNLVP